MLSKCRVATYLFSALEEKPVWVHSVGDGIANDREPVEDHRWLIGIFQEYLLQYVENYGENQEPDKSSSKHYPKASLRDLMADRLCDKFENAHR